MSVIASSHIGKESYSVQYAGSFIAAFEPSYYKVVVQVVYQSSFTAVVVESGQCLTSAYSIIFMVS